MSEDRKTSMEEYLEAGTAAVMASMKGDEVEHKKQILRAREYLIRHQEDQSLASLIEGQAQKEERKRQQRKKPKPQKKLSANLGDLLKQAGVVNEQ